MTENKATAKRVWKVEAAREAFDELTKAAGLEKQTLEGDVHGRNGMSTYEQTALKIQITEAYHRMLSGAYQTAAHIETQALSLQANVAAAFQDQSRH